jgi:hypothetical protein
VLLGDSYAAGNGARDARGDRDYHGPQDCYRSHSNWAEQYVDALERSGKPVVFVNRACSGGHVDHITEERDMGLSPFAVPVAGRHTMTDPDLPELARRGGACRSGYADEETFRDMKVTSIASHPLGSLLVGACRRFLRPQIDFVGRDTDLVLLTGGGNDVGFADVVAKCFAAGRTPNSCEDKVDAARDDLPGVQTELTAVLNKLRTEKLRADARVALVAYPYLEKSDKFGLKLFFDSYDAGRQVRKLGLDGDTSQRAAVTAANAAAPTPFVTYVDGVKPRFEGPPSHAPDGALTGRNPDRWVHEFETRIMAEWYHYNPDGHREIAGLLRDQGTFGAGTTPPAGAADIDIVFVIDTTGSMGSTISAVKEFAGDLVTKVAAGTASHRFALVTYRDHPEHTGSADDYPARVEQPFTEAAATFQSAVDKVTVDGGGDTPESAYSGLKAAIDLPWRPGVKKVVLQLGDAPAHDPEPVTGLTADTIVAASLAVDPAQVYAVEVQGGSSGEGLTGVAKRTGGSVVTAATPGEISTEVEKVINSALTEPQAWIGGPYVGRIGVAQSFDASGSYDTDGRLVSYEWDFTADGTYDQKTTAPATTHAYPEAHDGLVAVRVTDDSGATAVATVRAHASADGDEVPDEVDNCPKVPNHGQADEDGDGTGDECDDTPGWPAEDVAGLEEIDVTAATNAVPVAAPDTFSTDNRTTLTVAAPGVLANDTDADAGDTLTAAVVTKPKHGTATLAADGGLVYTANRGYTGTDVLTYLATDSKGAVSAPARVEISVTAPPVNRRQHLTIVANGRPPVHLSGPVTTGELTVKRTRGGVDRITGTATVRDFRGRSQPVVVTVRRSGRDWTATVVVRTPTGTRTLRGTGSVRERGATVTGVFRDRRVLFGLSITTQQGR